MISPRSAYLRNLVIIEMSKCDVCHDEFKDFELQNPRWCCSVKLCGECYKSTDSCPQCRTTIPEIDSDDIDLGNLKVNIKPEGYEIIISYGDYRQMNTFDDKGRITCSRFRKNDDTNCNLGDRPNEIHYKWDDNRIAQTVQCWFRSHLLHREDGPALVVLNDDGKVEAEKWCVDNKSSRGNDENGNELPCEIGYYRNGKISYEFFLKHRRVVHYYESGRKLCIVKCGSSCPIQTLYRDDDENGVLFEHYINL